MRAGSEAGQQQNLVDEASNCEGMRRAVHLLGRAFRETGQALDRVGLRVAEREIFNETYARHRPVMNLFDKVRKWAVEFLQKK